MSSLFSTLAHAGLGSFRARGALASAIHKGKAEKVRAYFRTAEVCALIGGLVLAACVLFCAFMTLNIAVEQGRESRRDAPDIPAEAGETPVTRLVDETGYISAYHLEDIPKDLERIAEEFHIQAAVYSSGEPAHDVYDQFFSGGDGVVLYIEEHEDYGRLSYYWGSGLDDVFTASNIALLDSRQTYLDAFTHDRANNVVSDFRSGLRTLFYGAEQAGDSLAFIYLTAIFWFAMTPVAFFLERVILYAALGLPRKKMVRREVLRVLLTQMNEDGSAGGVPAATE